MDTRRKIIKIAYETFYKQGFHACGVELLAQKAGITKRTLYSHFGSKDGLIAAVLDYRHQDFIERMQNALNQRPADETAEAYLEFIAGWTQENDFCGCLFMHACAEYTDPNSAPYAAAAEHKSQIRQILKNRLDSAQIANADISANRTFLIGEGMIAAAQAGQHDVVKEFQII